jgi:hypothetical protein
VDLVRVLRRLSPVRLRRWIALVANLAGRLSDRYLAGALGGAASAASFARVLVPLRAESIAD